MTSKSRRNFLKQSVGAAGAGIALQALPISIRDALAIQPAADGDWSKGLEHVVILMLENRSFDHMFGSLRGVRGFGDPKPMPMQAITKTVWNQPDFSGNYVYPFHIARDPGLSNTGDETPKCHGLNHAWRGDTSVYPSWKYWDHWTNKAYQSQVAENLGGMTMRYLTREDIPVFYSLAENFTICDAYHCSTFGATDTNRFYFLSGTDQNYTKDNIAGAGYNFDQGLYVGDISLDDIAETPNLPAWKTYAENLHLANVSAKVYREYDDGGCNYLQYFQQFRLNSNGTRFNYLQQNGDLPEPRLASYTDSWKFTSIRAGVPDTGAKENGFPNCTGDDLVAAIKNDIAAGTFPQVSWIVPPDFYIGYAGSHSARATEDFIVRLLGSLTSSHEVWSKTALFIMYDENDGSFDHVPANVPLVDGAQGSNYAPPGANSFPGETWDAGLKEKIGQYEKNNYDSQVVGLGPRVPMLIVSPFTKGGKVCSQVFDHTSISQFLETWLGNRYPEKTSALRCKNISPWRRTVCGDLTSTFGSGRDTSLDLNAGNLGRATAFDAAIQARFIAEGNDDIVPPSSQKPLARQDYQDRSVPACPLPYSLRVDVVSVDKTRQSITLSFKNDGTVGAAFIVYSRFLKTEGLPLNINDGPWHVTVESGATVELTLDNNDAQGNYNYLVYGPNGFYMQAKGNIKNPSYPEIDAKPYKSRGSVGIELTISNRNGPAFEFHFKSFCADDLAPMPEYNGNFIDKSFHHNGRFTVDARSVTSVKFDLSRSSGWHDIGIASIDKHLVRRFAGHVENGQFSRVDPNIGGMIRTDVEWDWDSV